ncbi:ferredoxin [Pandoraea eparura]|uniref:Ferredoxin n=2 Tax=Pandoraea eparura TaxID=2508291 RepID=A0A5E4UXN3_9BURK|nr:ferredoxin [Pandoraea eparura]
MPPATTASADNVVDGEKPVTWNVNDIPWIPLTGLFINKSGYKAVTEPAYTNDAYSIELTSVGPGGASPTHVEPHAHLFYVLSGVGEVTVGDETSPVCAGSVSPISAGVAHSFRNLGESALEMLVIYHPPRVRTKPPMPTLRTTVAALRQEATGVIRIELRPADGASFPAFTPGAHVDVRLPNGITRSYSLTNAPDETHRYVLGVLEVPESRGGSRYLHHELEVGAELIISSPRNNFSLADSTERAVLIAGGIGITPLLCMARHLRAQGRDVVLAYCAQTRKHAAFVDDILALGIPVMWHFDDEQGVQFDLERYMASQPRDAHFYACGPGGFLGAFERACHDLGIQNGHIERFSGAKPAAEPRSSYAVTLNRSGRTLSVEPGTTLLQTLLSAGVEVPYSCQEGVCGACKTAVLAGEPDHRDSVLTATERASNTVMTVCVSGCRTPSLRLDL